MQASRALFYRFLLVFHLFKVFFVLFRCQLTDEMYATFMECIIFSSALQSVSDDQQHQALFLSSSFFFLNYIAGRLWLFIVALLRILFDDIFTILWFGKSVRRKKKLAFFNLRIELTRARHLKIMKRHYK